MITIKSSLKSLSDNFDAPQFVRLEFTESEVKRIKELRKFINENKDVSSLQMIKTGDIFNIDDNEQECQSEWREQGEKLLIFEHAIYYIAYSKYDSSDEVESEDLTDNEEFLNLLK